MTPNVKVHFIDKKGEIIKLTYMPFYPSYVKGQRICLESRYHDIKLFNKFPLTEYKITDVIHGLSTYERTGYEEIIYPSVEVTLELVK